MIGVIGDADRRVVAGGEARAGDDDVDRAELQALVDVGFLAELRGREDVDLVAAVGALADLFGRPDRLRVEWLGRLVDMRPFQRGLRRSRRGGETSAASAPATTAYFLSMVFLL